MFPTYTLFQIRLFLSFSLTAEFCLQFDALVEHDFVQPGEAESKKKRLAEKKRQGETDTISRKRRKGTSATDAGVIHNDQLGVKIAKTS